jgi:catechol 2,3-dioxygenase-like lactoylglutathione lyase family enzyme
MGSRVNHVSVSATDLDASTEFYVQLIGAVRVPSPNFDVEVRWLALGDTQLHLFRDDVRPTQGHHFGVEVDLDVLVAAYRTATERGILDEETFNGGLIGLPGDVAQLYLRDPSGNLVELDAVRAADLPEDMRGRLRVLADRRPQDGEHAGARLFIGDERPAPTSVQNV